MSRNLEEEHSDLEEETLVRREKHMGDEYELQGKIGTILKLAAICMGAAGEHLYSADVSTSYTNAYAWAQTEDITFASFWPWTDDVRKVRKNMPAWGGQSIYAVPFDVPTYVPGRDMHLSIEYVWGTENRILVDSKKLTSHQYHFDTMEPEHTLPTEGQNTDGLRFIWDNHQYSTWQLTHNCYTGETGGGGCPYISTWNGEEYTSENNILWQSDDKLGAQEEMNIKDYYLLDNIPEKNGRYSIQLEELGNDMSFIKYAGLQAIDRPEDTEIAVDQNGEIIIYDEILRPSEINIKTDTFENGEDIDMLTSENEESIKVRAGEEIMLDYSKQTQPMDEQNKVLLIDIDAKNSVPELSVNDGDGWSDIDKFLSRSNGGIQAINLEGRSDIDKIEQIKFVFNGDHNIDILGFADVFDENYKVEELERVNLEAESAQNLEDTGTYTKLTPTSEAITLEYEMPPIKEGMERELMLEIEGFYTNYIKEDHLIEGVATKPVAVGEGRLYTPILKSYDEVESFRWEFNDGTVSNDFQPYRQYNSAISAEGTLLVRYIDGETKTFHFFEG